MHVSFTSRGDSASRGLYECSGCACEVPFSLLPALLVRAQGKVVILCIFTLPSIEIGARALDRNYVEASASLEIKSVPTLWSPRQAEVADLLEGARQRNTV